MMVFRPGDKVSARAWDQGARLMLLGGATMNGPRYIWWNFVSSSKDRIIEASRAWHAAHSRSVKGLHSDSAMGSMCDRRNRPGSCLPGPIVWH